MKHTAFAAALLITLTLLAGCQSGNTGAGFAEEDLSLSIDGTSCQIDMDIESVIAALGEEYAYSEAISCDYDGLDKIFIYPQAEFFTFPLAEGDLVNEIYTQDPSVSTSKGIAIGATRAEVLAAYGEDAQQSGSLLVYRIPPSDTKPNGQSLCFELEDDVVTAIILTTQPI